MVIIARCLSVAAWLAAAVVYFSGGPGFLESAAATVCALFLAGVGYAAWLPSRQNAPERPRNRERPQA